jgi:hypothetical protein
VSESALLKRVIEALIGGNEVRIATVTPLEPVPSSGRLSVRLAIDDLLLLRERARSRGIPSATYISLLVRSHLRNLSPIPDNELKTLQQAIGQVSAIGHFSMPPGTPPPLLLKAVRKLARTQFGSDHRYVLVLHTDEPHPHVHVIVKAMSEQGERLNIRKATLRQWRQEFAANLRELGVSANATERAVRGQFKTSMPDGIYRAAQRDESSYDRDRLRRAATSTSSKETLVRTREHVVDGWRAVSARLRADGYPNLANHVDRFLTQMPSVSTDAEMVSDQARSSGRRRDVRPSERTR